MLEVVTPRLPSPWRREATADGPWIVLGLGNPGSEYETSRHNAGEMAVEVLARRFGGALKRSRNRARTAEVRDGDRRLVLAVPSSYMNDSGGPASLLVRYYKTPPERLIVLHDDIDLQPGTLQLRIGGGSAGHNGVKDIAKALGTPQFLRVRMGVGRPPGRQDPADYVLEPTRGRVADDLAVLAERAADAALDLVGEPLEKAQEQHNH